MFVAATVLLALATVARVQAVDPKYLPGDTEIVITINVKQMLDSEILKGQKDQLDAIKAAIKGALPFQEAAQKYLEMAGFDPFKDFGSVTIAGPPTKDPDAFMILVEGTFDQAKIDKAAEAAAKDLGDAFKITKAGRFKIFEVTPPGEKRMYASLVSMSTMVICTSEDAMKGALARAAGTKKSALKKEVSALVARTSPKQSISMVATGSALAKLSEDAPGAGQVGDYLKSVEGVRGALTISKDLKLDIDVFTKDVATAKEFARQAQAGLNAVRVFAGLKAAQDERFVPVADAVKSLKASSTGNILELSGEISFENIQKLLKNFQP
jgi:hypothetical protein